MKICPVCRGEGVWYDYDGMFDHRNNCDSCDKTGKVLTEFEINEIRIDKALEDAWEKNR